MIGFLQFSTADLAQVPNYLRATQMQIDRAGKRAVRKVANSTASQLARAISAAHDLPLRLLRKRGKPWNRVSVKHLDHAADHPGPTSVVWVGFNPIRASYLGAPRQTREGVKVRGHIFRGAFISTMPSGHRGVFMRRGRDRLPIDEQSVQLSEARGIVQKFQAALPARLNTVFRQEMNYELNVRGK